MAKLRGDGDNAPAQAKMFEAVLDQRALVDKANSKTKAARRSVQRRNDAANATMSAAQDYGGFCGLLETCEACQGRSLGRLSRDAEIRPSAHGRLVVPG